LTYMAPFAEWPEGSKYREAANIRHPLADRLASHCAARGIPLLDVTGALQDAVRRGRRPAFKADTHLTRDGHDAVAAAISAWLPELDEPRLPFAVDVLEASYRRE
jgi:lysophospholipase L1-like esterase